MDILINDLISIITPSYNSGRFISHTIESVMAQTYTNWEMIIVDDCSIDNSVEIITFFKEQDNRIKLVELETNQGAAVARNKSIELSKGRFIAFLDSDDLWLPQKLEKQLQFMTTQNVSFSYASYRLIDDNGNPLGKFRVPTRQSYSDILKTCSIGCLTAMYDTKSFGKVYMPLIKRRQDLGLWLSLLKKIDYAYGIDDYLAIYRKRDRSISSNKVVAAQYQWRIYREIEKLSFIKSLYYFVHYTFNGIIKHKDYYNL